MPMDGNDVLLLLSLHMANPGACLHPSPQTLGWGGTSTTFTRGLTFGLTSIRMDTAGGGADDLLGRAALPLKVGHPADHCVILRERQVISLSVSLSLCLCHSMSLSFSPSLCLGRRLRHSEEDRRYHLCFHLSICDTHARTHARSCLLSPLSLARVLFQGQGVQGSNGKYPSLHIR